MSRNRNTTLKENQTRIHRSRLWAATCMLQIVSLMSLFYYYFPSFSSIRKHFEQDILEITQGLILCQLLLDMGLRVYLIGSEFLDYWCNKVDVFVVLLFTACYVYMCQYEFNYYAAALEIIVMSIRCVLMALRLARVIKATCEHVKNCKNIDEIHIPAGNVNFTQNAEQESGNNKIQNLDIENLFGNTSPDTQIEVGIVVCNARLVQVNRNPRNLVVEVGSTNDTNYTWKSKGRVENAIYCESREPCTKVAKKKISRLNREVDGMPNLGEQESA
jgi:hypothetical protein